MILALKAGGTGNSAAAGERSASGRHHLASRSDYRTVNSVLCFPFIFRGALDVGATAINEVRRSGGPWLPSGTRRTERSGALGYGDQDLWAGHIIRNRLTRV